MTAFYFLAGLIGVVYIIWWSIKKDNVESLDQQTGLLRMNVPEGNKERGSPITYGSAPPTDQDPSEHNHEEPQPPGP